MDPGDIPLFAMLRGRMGYLSERQRVISENVANSDTPGYRPHDLKPFTFEAQVKLASSAAVAPGVVQSMTRQPHMQAPSAGRPAAPKPTRGRDSETTLDGNSVVLEEQMLKMTDARMNYDAAISFYTKSLNMLRIAIRKPGAG